MLRASSLGLRCYRTKLHSAASLPCRTAVLAFGQPWRYVASDSTSPASASRPGRVGKDRPAVRASPPHQKQPDHLSDQVDWDVAQKLWREKDWEWGEASTQMDADPSPIPNYPTGNRHRGPTPALRRTPRWTPPNREHTRSPYSSTSPFTDEDKSRGGSDVSVAAIPDATHGVHLPAEEAEDSYHTQRATCLNILADTEDASEAWDAYQALMSLPRDGTRLPVPWEHLNRLTRLISIIRPRTRTLFLRLLSVLTTIHRTGGTVELWQWNALIDFAGKGFRRTRFDTYKDALDVYGDLVAGYEPGATFARKHTYAGGQEDEVPVTSDLKPDVYTLTTLLNIAANTLQDENLLRVWALMKSLDIAPNRVTYLVMMKYYTKAQNLASVRQMIHTMRLEGHELGLDGLNQCTWAFARLSRFETSEAIYNVLKYNLIGGSEMTVRRARKYLAGQHIMIPPNVIPDEITYMALLQPYTYHGRFKPALDVFYDMVEHLSTTDLSTLDYALPAYRAMFLGFYRWGAIPPPNERSNDGPYRFSVFHDKDTQSEWAFSALENIFESFVALPGDFRPSERMVYWILMSFARITGNNMDVLRKVLAQLEARFEVRWGGRLGRVRMKLLKMTLEQIQ